MPRDKIGERSEIIAKVNDLFEGDLTDDDKLIYVNNVIKGKLMESAILAEQAANNTKEQFASSPDLTASCWLRVPQVAGLPPASSRPHFTMTPLPLANGWCNQPPYGTFTL